MSAGGGYSTVVVQKPYGGSRAIYFRMRKAIGANTNQAVGYPEFSAKRENDLNIIHRAGALQDSGRGAAGG
jgi:hypothetical protein